MMIMRTTLAFALVLACAAVAARAQSARAIGGVAKPPVRFAVIGDYGAAGSNEQGVAALVRRFQPEFVVTAGDNNYPDGEDATIDANVGQYYHEFIAPYFGAYGRGAATNRFYPCLGNHDWHTTGALPYLSYFTLPGNERYYDVDKGPLHFFMLDSDPSEPDGITSASPQAQWLQSALAASSAPFKVVVLHHAPYSSSEHGSNASLQWPYASWGATLVVCGHDHVYERLEVDGVPYIVDGLGGKSLYAFGAPIAGSEVRFNDEFGALFGVATEHGLQLSHVTSAGIVIDQSWIAPVAKQLQEITLIARGSSWKYLDDGSNQGSAWSHAAFDDASWNSGLAQLGYGDGDETTVVSYGADPQNKYVTTYFRHQIAIADPSQFREVRLRVLRDDGAIAFVNGVEVMRTNMPGGPVDYLTLASGAVEDPEEDGYYQVMLQPNQFAVGNNVIAVEIHQARRTSSDISFDLDLAGIKGGTVLFARGGTWHYLDTGADLGDAWRDPSYDDTSWASGPAELGYGDGDEATVVSYGPDPNDKHVTTYFRTAFQATHAGWFENLLLRIRRDDGVVVSLNGKEAYRGNVPGDHVTAASLAGYVIDGTEEAAFFTTRIDPRLLVNGTNVLAVEVHQVDPASSDISMELELIGL